MPSRRAFLITGAASVAIVGGGLFGARIFLADSSEAREPWAAAAEGFGDTRLDILAYAILAPNPHNRQPWLIELIDADRIRLTADLDRMLPETDPPNRQITIGLGAFLELLRMAAAEKGYRAETTPFPEGEPWPVLDRRPIADIVLKREPSIAGDELFETVLERRTNRAAYQAGRSLTAVQLAYFEDVLAGAGNISFAGTSDAEQVARLKQIATEGWLVEYQTERTHMESNRLMRIGADEINANPDGISMEGAMMEAGNSVGFITRETLSDPDSYAYGEGISMYSALIDASPSFGWLVSQGNSRVDQLATGAAWVRTHLAATRSGIALQPLSQVLQEFPEMGDHYAQLHEAVDVAEPARVQGLFRMGYASPPPPSPRWPLTSRLIVTE